jgi:chromosomal replication initiation ATPase DnaA
LLLEHSAEELAAPGKPLVIDGIDPWLGERKAEEALFHLYNIFKESGRSLMLTMRMTPTQAEFAVPDLASRLRAAPLAAIKPPDDMLLGSVLIKLFSDRQLPVGHEVIAYILPRMERSFSAARDIVKTADQTALAARQKISVPLMRKVLAGMQGESGL